MSLPKPLVDSYNTTNNTCRFGLGRSFKGIGDICPKGHYCKSGSAHPVPCPSGSYNNEIGQDKCLFCPPGFYCFEGTISYENMSCPSGHYCTENTTLPYKCKNGTFNNLTQQVNEIACKPCLKGYYCEGKGNSQPTGHCAAGWYCNGSSTQNTPGVNGGKCQPGFYCPIGSSKPIKCDLGMYCNIEGLQYPKGNCSAGWYCSLGSSRPDPPNGLCTAGHYCPEGTKAPMPCMPGTFHGATNAKNESFCEPCTRGMFCNQSGLREPAGYCLPGYYCPPGQQSPTAFECSEGYYCEGGKGNQEPCISGTYQDQKAKPKCKKCVGRYVCNATFGPVVNYTQNICPSGFYCPEGTEFDYQFPCPIGTFNNLTGRANETECTKCLGGFYCGIPGLIYPTTSCSEGYYCQVGAKTASPQQGKFANICPYGHYCPKHTIQPKKCKIGTLGRAENLTSQEQCTDCPAGLFCETPGTYNLTTDCFAGYYCPNGSSRGDQNICPSGSYCPPGSALYEDCPNGTYSNHSRLTHVDNCTKCESGQYCKDYGLVSPSGYCKGGFYCPEGSTKEDQVDCWIGFHCPKGRCCLIYLLSKFLFIYIEENNEELRH